MLVLILGSCTKDTITPIPDTQLEGLKGKVKSKTAISSNGFFGLPCKQIILYDDLGYKISEEILIDENRKGEYSLLARMEYAPYQDSTRISKTYGADHKLYDVTTTKWLTSQDYTIIRVNEEDKGEIHKEVVKTDDKGRQIHKVGLREYIGKSQVDTIFRDIFEYDEKGDKVLEKSRLTNESYGKIKVTNLAFDKYANITRQKTSSEDIDANYEVEYTYEYYE
ncbi:hypothetical protein HX082_08930 [Myroides odoratimimus]|nr:hypothetical protein [Myroides odoratimimus]MDM1509519.1 hypothetical protein [Myroides odoratimimus]MDM1511512.1 hypothetical protein [Myroides odoratimimus]MDM1518554.1 hypothetical protein [Myroides odoratimimus]MDM1525770.1 hypothetical protein [Myroides odoratimimus]